MLEFNQKMTKVFLVCYSRNPVVGATYSHALSVLACVSWHPNIVWCSAATDVMNSGSMSFSNYYYYYSLFNALCVGRKDDESQ